MPTAPRPSTAPPATGYRINTTLGKYRKDGVLRNLIRRTISNAKKNKNKTSKRNNLKNRQTRRRR